MQGWAFIWRRSSAMRPSSPSAASRACFLGGGSWGTAMRRLVARSLRDLGLLALKCGGTFTRVSASTGTGTSTSVSRRICLSSVSTVGDAGSPR